MEKNIIDGVRAYYQLPDSVTDEKIKADLTGSFGESVVKFRFAKEELKTALQCCLGLMFPNTFKQWNDYHAVIVEIKAINPDVDMDKVRAWTNEKRGDLTVLEYLQYIKRLCGECRPMPWEE